MWTIISKSKRVSKLIQRTRRVVLDIDLSEIHIGSEKGQPMKLKRLARYHWLRRDMSSSSTSRHPAMGIL